MKHARINAADRAESQPLNGALDAIEQLLAQLGPDADTDDAALALWEPTRRLGKAFGFDDLRKYYQCIEVHRRLPNFGKLILGFAV